MLQCVAACCTCLRSSACSAGDAEERANEGEEDRAGDEGENEIKRARESGESEMEGDEGGGERVNERDMGWLRLVGSFKLKVSFAE